MTEIDFNLSQSGTMFSPAQKLNQDVDNEMMQKFSVNLADSQSFNE